MQSLLTRNILLREIKKRNLDHVNIEKFDKWFSSLKTPELCVSALNEDQMNKMFQKFKEEK